MSRRVQCPKCRSDFTCDDAPAADSQNVFIDARGETTRSAKRGRITTRGLLIRLFGVASVAAVTLAGGILLTRQGRRAAAPTPPPIRTAGETAAADSASNPPTEAGQPRPLDEMLESLEFAVVKIESTDFDRGSALGSGFVIDDSGLIATSYHVVSQATQARVRFQDGSSFDVVGYAAVQPENDLAIVKLAGTPANLTVMQLSAKRDPPRLSAVIAIGHPHGVEFSPYDGRVSRVLRSSQLPRRSREFLSSVLSVKYDQRWIQHTARIAEGNSGGPLIDSSGQVVGVNTWVDESSHFGYALHVEHLAKLHAAATEEIEPLADHARRETRVARLLQDLSAEKIQQLYAAAAEFSFQPRSERQDETVSQLAWALTAANLPGSFAPSGVLEKHLDEVEAAADGVIAKLTKRRWDGPGQIALINELAVEKIARPLSGLMLVATVKRVVEGERGSRGMLLQLAGMGQTLFIPLDGVLFSPEPGESFLVIGVNYNGGVVRYGDNPLQLITAPLIASRTFIPLGK